MNFLRVHGGTVLDNEPRGLTESITFAWGGDLPLKISGFRGGLRAEARLLGPLGTVLYRESFDWPQSDDVEKKWVIGMTPQRFEGRVVLSANQPAKGAMITLDNERLTCRTDGDGRFVIEGVYALSASGVVSYASHVSRNVLFEEDSGYEIHLEQSREVFVKIVTQDRIPAEVDSVEMVSIDGAKTLDRIQAQRRTTGLYRFEGIPKRPVTVEIRRGESTFRGDLDGDAETLSVTIPAK